MSNMLKCPNPSCPYAFDPSQVPTGVVLSCPRCSMQFTLGAPSAAPPPPPSRPDFVDTEFEAVGRSAVEDRDPDAPIPGRRTSSYQVFILAGIAAVLMAGTTLAILFKVLNLGKRDPGPTDIALRDKDRNVGLDALPTGWTQDDATWRKVGTPYAYGFKRENPEAYVAFGSAEYAKGRSPRSTEMRRHLVLPMQKLFTKYEEELASETNWLGQVVGARHAFKFRAPSPDGLIWQGEAYAVASKGIGYFWVGWSGEGDFDGLKDEFARFRKGFKLLDPTRDNWREVVAKEVDYKGATTPYTFTDADAIWNEESHEADKKINPDLDRLLRINHTPRNDRKALSDDADLRVYLLDPAGDPLQQARAYVETHWIDHVKMSSVGLTSPLPAPTFTELAGEAVGDELPKGTTPHVRLESKVVDPVTKRIAASSESRLIVVSGVRVGDKTVVLHCWCEWSKREVFETRFIQIASSLR